MRANQAGATVYMILLSFMIVCGAAAPAFAQDFAWTRPTMPAVSSQDCPRAVDLVVGQPVPAGLLDADGLVACRAVVVPPADAGHLLLIDTWSEQAVARGLRLDVELQVERERVVALRAELDRPVPWLQRPGTQRTLGRIETVVVVALVGALVIGLDQGAEL